jgi:hypothetical protein
MRYPLGQSVTVLQWQLAQAALYDGWTRFVFCQGRVSDPVCVCSAMVPVQVAYRRRKV